jgi:hypothetical protein
LLQFEMGRTLFLMISVAFVACAHSGLSFAKPVRLGPTDAMSDEFYAVGPLGNRVVFGMHPKMVASGRIGSPPRQVYPYTMATMSSTGGRSWTPIPQSCAGIVSRDRRYTLAAYPSQCSDSDPSVCTALTSFGNFSDIRSKTTSASTVFNATGATVISYSNGTLRCSPKTPVVTTITGLPPLIVCCSVGGLRFSGAAAIYLGPGGENRYLATVLGELASESKAQDGMTILAVASADGINWHYLSTIANYSTPHMNSAEGGPNEMDLAWLPDNKRIIAMMRICGGAVADCTQNYARSVSSDRGATWSAPMLVPNVGSARPRLLQMGSTMILGGGRMWNGGDMINHNNLQNGTNDNMLWAATDGEGLEWTPYALSYHHNMGEPDPGLHFTAGVNCSLYRGDMTVGQPHTDFETHAYLSLVQLTKNTGLVVYQYTGKTVVNTTLQCDEQPIQYYFERRMWGANVTGQAACAAANDTRNIGRTFYTTGCPSKCAHWGCCWTGRSIARPYKNGTFAMVFTVADPSSHGALENTRAH